MTKCAAVSGKTGCFEQCLISCEHASNLVPHEFATVFAGAESLLAGHRGYDPGALEAAEILSDGLSAPLFAAEWTRLLADLNRSVTNRRIFSEYTANLETTARQQILQCYYHPYRNSVTGAIDRAVSRRRRVLHLGVHSFTPVLNGAVRNATVGLLYDPSRVSEKFLCTGMKEHLRQEGVATRCNYPYRGVSDGLTAALRKKFGPQDYCGIEIELNQAVWFSSKSEWQRLTNAVLQAVQAISASVR